MQYKRDTSKLYFYILNRKNNSYERNFFKIGNISVYLSNTKRTLFNKCQNKIAGIIFKESAVK